MKNCQIFIGSPRKNGNTSLMSDMLVSAAKDFDINFEKSFLYDLNIKPCTDCRVCKKGDLVCLVNDGMKTLYSKLDETDTIIIGSPIYWYSTTAQTKLFIDRLRPYYGNKKLKGKNLGLLLPAGVGSRDCDLTIAMIKRMCEALELNYIGEITAEAYDEGDVKKLSLDSEFKKLAEKI